MKSNFKDIASSHLPKVVLPVPGRAEIPIIFRSENLFLNLLDKLKNLEFTLASEPNGYGWKNEINKLINELKLI